MRLRQSFWAMLGRETVDTPTVVVERIRKDMLLALDAHCGDAHYTLDIKISFARNISELWYLRPDLMHAISACREESVARAALNQITLLFQGYMLEATPSRFGAL